MPKYAIHNSEGEILRVLDIPADAIALQVQEGEYFLEADAETHHSINMTTMEVIRNELPPEPVSEEPPPAPYVPDYVAQRTRLYPTIESQLDMLWHAMNAGEIPKATEFFNRIKLVKDAVVKDTTADPTIIYTIDPLQEDAE